MVTNKQIDSPPDKRRRLSYINFFEVVKLFPEEKTEVLCKLADLSDITPSKVYSIVPSATTKQICQFLQLAEDSYAKDKVEMTTVIGTARKVNKF